MHVAWSTDHSLERSSTGSLECSLRCLDHDWCVLDVYTYCYNTLQSHLTYAIQAWWRSLSGKALRRRTSNTTYQFGVDLQHYSAYTHCAGGSTKYFDRLTNQFYSYEKSKHVLIRGTYWSTTIIYGPGRQSECRKLSLGSSPSFHSWRFAKSQRAFELTIDRFFESKSEFLKHETDRNR